MEHYSVLKWLNKNVNLTLLTQTILINVWKQNSSLNLNMINYDSATQTGYVVRCPGYTVYIYSKHYPPIRHFSLLNVNAAGACGYDFVCDGRRLVRAYLRRRRGAI